MPTSVAITFVLIIVARITDVTLDTVRTAAIIQGRRVFAAVLGFFEAVIYICVVAKVLLNVNHPIYALAYGTGFASGTFLGILIEQHLAFGEQVVSLFTRKGAELSKALADAGYLTAEVHGHTREGDLAILHVEIPRKLTRDLVRDATAVDPSCFCVINDVRMAKFLAGSTQNSTHMGMSTSDAHGFARLKRQ
ncbi:MAG TPA: DUF5698 domain-containing protein [Terriglobales bacterium]|jgi:uncharacterized protein YebE (UPF0316 family)|nr:DUF5698 domain-containing protein [Terriglobales bacterium]